MSTAIPFIIFLLLFLVELAYFRMAEKFNIIDQPNHRSSHTNLTIRGGGVIFIVGMLIYPVFYGFSYMFFLMGLFGIGLISFMDDIKPVSNKLRIFIHLICVALMFYQLDLFSLPFYWILLALFLVIGSINAINFMDGINGITGSYAFLIFCTFLYVNINLINFTDSHLIITSLISVIVFNFFNFRKRARCFAGDVGSVGIAFIVMFFLLQLMIKSENFNYLLLLLLYGMDVVTTMIFRKIRKENIFDAHRSHFYQYLANEKKIPHLTVSLIYVIAQLLINLLIIFWLPQSIFLLVVFLLVSTLIFLAIRFLTEGKNVLLAHRNLN